MFNKILIANRGEIAVRIIRACREMGIATVAVFSEADREALHAQLADEAVCIGPARARDSYLHMENILSAACVTRAEAIHPGFGFLSENSAFAKMCAECSIKFIGPDASVIERLGDKAEAKKTMKAAGVPVIPGSEGAFSGLDEARRIAVQLKYPVLVKAAAGGGGRGIRIVRAENELAQAIDAASGEAMAAFGDGSLYMEKMIENARHIEIQLLGDEHGHVIHLGERDCSLQRRNQKVLEESPSIALSAAQRDEMGEAACRAAVAVGYTNAGTAEFLLDREGNFYFMEMNTRIQVEHPVTEMVTGVDVVKEQLMVAAGEPFAFTQEDVRLSGHAIECRINAEDAARGFAPSPGKVAYLHLPGGGPGLRVDSAMYAGCDIPPHYDSMIAKVITHGATRAEAIAKMRRALEEFVIQGVETNLDFQMELLWHPAFLRGETDTGFIAREWA